MQQLPILEFEVALPPPDNREVPAPWQIVRHFRRWKLICPQGTLCSPLSPGYPLTFPDPSKALDHLLIYLKSLEND